jgi:serine-type D-Ala-D-Ala carboxypeptidase/endopeptidase
MRRIIFLVFAVAAFAAGCASRSAPPLVPEAASLRQVHIASTLHPNLSDGQRVKAAIAQALAALPSPTAPGIAIALNYHGKAFYYYQGVQKLGGRPVDGNTIFEMGSVTKSFTGILLANAVNLGIRRVALNDPPGKWVLISGDPDATAPKPVATSCAVPTATPLPPTSYGSFTNMTLFELATHTSGLPDVIPGVYGSNIGRQCFSPQMFLNYVEGGTFRRPPAPWLYSNFGFGTLGYALQRVYATNLKKPPQWIDIARQQILDPLGMTSTFDLNVPRKYQKYYAVGYLFDTAGQPEQQLHWLWDPWPAAGTLRSTAPDMLRYLRMAMNVAGPANLRAAAQIAQRPYVKVSPFGGQGLAWETVPLYAASTPSPSPPPVAWKDGGTAGFSSWIGAVRKPDVANPMGIVVMFNIGSQDNVGPFARAILTTLYLEDKPRSIVTLSVAPKVRSRRAASGV